MTVRRRLAAMTAAVGLFPLGSPAAAQTVGTVDMGASVVEYDGFLVSGAAVLAAALKFDAPALSLGAQGSWTIFESGNQILQGTAAAGWLTPPLGMWRVEFSGSLGGAKYADQPSYGHVLTRTRLHLSGERVGGWVSATTGGSFGESSEVPFELAVGAWSVQDRLALVGTASATWIAGDRHVDLLGAGRWTMGRVELEARAGLRPWTESGGGVGEARVGAFADASALVAFTRRVSLAVSGGSYPSDPVHRVLGATYVTVGLRFEILPAAAPPVPTIPAALARAVRERAEPATGLPRLEVAPSGDRRALRVHVARARSVELMGDFTDWHIVELTRTGSGTWEMHLPLSPGVHRLNIRIDGGAWLVPQGARLEEGEFGGPVGIVVVP